MSSTKKRARHLASRLPRGALAALIVGAVVVAVVPRPGTSAPTTSLVASSALTWAPPSGWENYPIVTVPATGGTVTLPSNAQDYRLVASQTITRSVIVRGGRNVVWVGGHIRIDRNDAQNGALVAPTARRGLLIDDGTASGVVTGRVVFIEGIRIDGDDLSEGIDTKAPKADVILQNIGIGEIRHRGFDDRDSTGSYAQFLPTRNHPDVIQLFGGYRTLLVDGLSARTNYQGLFLSTDAVAGPGGDIRLRRVDIAAVEKPDDASPYLHAGHRGITWYGNEVGQMFLDPGTVWFQHHPNSGWGTSGGFKRVAFRASDGTVTPEPVSGNAQFINNFGAGSTYPFTDSSGAYAATASTDATGTYASWSAAATLADGRPAFRDWTGADAGRVYSGSPPSGTYVPLSAVGLGYVSPGYTGGAGTSTTTTAPASSSTTTSTAPATTTTTVPATTTTTAAPATLTPATTFPATADAWVEADRPTTNRGDDEQLRVAQSSGRSTYTTFDLTTLAGAPVSRARLRLTVEDASANAIALHIVSSNWREDTLTYANRPALGAIIATFTPSRKGTVDVDITSQVRASAGGPLSVAIVATGSDTLRLTSKEGGSGPQLVIDG